MKTALSSLLIALVLSSYGQETIELSEEKILADNLEFRKEMNEYFADPEKSALPLFLIDEFTEAPYYDVDMDYVVVARFEELEDGPMIKMKTSTDRIAEYQLYGKAYFALSGDSLSLNLYKSESEDGEEHLFLPFKDLTNDDGTYAVGRYLDIESPQGNQLLIDFNKSYNPSCAYSNRYSCPRVPVDNHLDVPVEAGAQYIKHEAGWNELDKRPQYKGNFGADIRKNYRYPKSARKDKVEGVVYVKMIVNKDGSLSNFQVVQGLQEECDEVAMNVAKGLKSFKPARKNGEAVRSFLVIPVEFSL